MAKHNPRQEAVLNDKAKSSETETTEASTETTGQTTGEATTAAAADPAPQPVAVAASDERFIKIKHPHTGKMVNRKDFILEQATLGVSRGAIAKALSEIQGKKVPYQIVFAATKHLKPYPQPKGTQQTPTAAENAEVKQAESAAETTTEAAA